MYTASNNINIGFERYILLTVEHFWLVSLLKDRTVDDDSNHSSWTEAEVLKPGNFIT